MLKLKNKKIFVSGATGKIGRHLVKQLVKEKALVKVLIRRKTDLFNKLSNIETVIGDITKVNSFELDGCDCIVHLAAYQNMNDDNYANFRKVNVDGTKNIIEKAIKSNVKKLVYVSTVMVFEPTDKELRDESWVKKNIESENNFYTKSKLEALDIVKSYKDKINIVTVYPTIVIDKDEILKSFFSGNWWQKIVWNFFGRGIPGGVMCLIGSKDRIINFIWMDELVNKLIRLLNSKNNEDEYILCGENINYITKHYEI